MTNTKLELRFEGWNGSTDIVEEVTGKTVTNTNATISTAQYINSDSSGYFPNTANLVVDVSDGSCNIGTNDFAIEFYVRFADTSTQVIMDYRQTSASDIAPVIYLNSSKFKLYVSSGYVLSCTSTIVINTWYHFALTRQGNFTRMFVNGVQEASMVDTNNYINVTTLKIGSTYLSGSTFNGYLSRLRISDVARYVEGFNDDWVIPNYFKTTTKYFNKRDYDRLNTNITFLASFISTYLGGTVTLPNTAITIDRKTFGRAQLINEVEENINELKDYLGATPTGWVTLYATWAAQLYTFNYTSVNNLETDLQIIYDNLNDIYSFLNFYRVGSSRVICGGGFPLF